MAATQSYNILLLHIPKPFSSPESVTSYGDVVIEDLIESIKVEPDVSPMWDFPKCHMCHYKTKSQYALSQHLKRHKVTKYSRFFNCMGPIEPYRCNKCRYRTPLAVSFAKHIEVNHRLPAHNFTPEPNQQHPEALMAKLNWKNLLKNYDCEKCSFRTFSQLLYVVHCRKCPVRNFLRKASQDRQAAYSMLPGNFKPAQKKALPLPKRKHDKVKAPTLEKSKPVESVPIVNSDSDEDTASNIEPLPPAPTPKPAIDYDPDPLQTESSDGVDSDDNWGKPKQRNKSIKPVKRKSNVKEPEPPIKKPRTKSGHNSRKFYNCKECFFATNSLTSYVTHLKCRHAVVTQWFQCEVCDFRTISSLNFQKHKANAKHPSIKCTMCEYQTSSKEVLKKHVQTEHILSNTGVKTKSPTKNLFKCDSCKFQTTKDEDLKSHILKKHVAEETVICYNCKVCSFKTIIKNELSQHVMEKHVDPQHSEWFPCEMCTYKFKQRQDLKKHIFAKHIM